MRRTPIRMKLALALALPLLALVAITAIAVTATTGGPDTLLIVLAGAAVAGAVVLAVVVSRSITEPLRSLTEQVKDLADNRLPDAVLDILDTPLGDDVRPPQTTPVSVPTNDEVSDVADALNTVQETALHLALEQAVLRRNIADSFVNLGRRNQNLLGRQLDFITELESNETDPDTLASLFRLDHLATRMRRNAESLLVLAGIDPPRKWAAPVRLTDVIRAALGEVEDYQRVTIRDVQAATVIGSVAADLAHLVAELLENALTFSPPDQHVEVSGRAAGGGYRLAVVDHGLGMEDGDLEQANRRLMGAESFTIAPSKYLGHYVAGNLAARHGIHLHLSNVPGTGVAATVDLPATILTAEAPDGDPITDPYATRAVGAGASPRPPTPDAADSAADAAAPAGNVPPAPAAGPSPMGTPATVASHHPPLRGGPVTAPRVQGGRTASGLAKRERRPGPDREAARAPAVPSRGSGSRRLPTGPPEAHDALLANIAKALPRLTGRPTTTADDAASERDPAS